MILQLTREQLRSQKRFVAWTAALLTVAIALASYAAITTTTQISNELAAQRITGDANTIHGYANSIAGGVKRSSDIDGSPLVSLETVDAQVQAAIDSGSDIQVSRDTYLVAATSYNHAGHFLNLVSMTGDYAWDKVLVKGTPPGAGEIAVSRRVATELSIDLGDNVDTYTGMYEVAGESSSSSAGPVTSLTLSGITYTPGVGSTYGVGLPEAVASWEDSTALAIAGYGASLDASEGTPIFTSASWTSATTDLSAFDQQDGSYGASARLNASSGVSIAVSVALFIGLIAMSFAVGRSQAQARTSWAATARAMGARRSTVAVATLLETFVVGLAASVFGIVTGWLSVVGDLALIHRSVPDAFLPSAPVVVWWVLGGVLLLGLVIAAIVGAVPAFWASRVSPVAALKPVSPIIEAEVSRRVSVRGVAIIWGISVVLVWFSGAHSDSDQVLAALNILALIAFVVLSFVLTQELLREATPQLGRMLGHSARPWAIAAGDSIVARPRQSAIPALVMTIAAFGGVASATFTYMDNWLVQAMLDNSGEFGWLTSSYGFSGTTVGVVNSLAATVAVLIALAIFASGSRASLCDDATRGALGMTVADARRARAAHFGLPLVTGVALGWILGLAGGIILSLRSHQTGALGAGYNWPLAAIPSTVVPNLVVVAISLGVIAIGAAIVAATTSHRTPVDDLSHV